MKKQIKRLLVRLASVITILGMVGIAVYDPSKFTTMLAIIVTLGVSPLVLGRFDIDSIWPDRK